MSETPTTPAAASAEQAPEETAPRPKGTLQEMLEAGAHFGHQTRRWDPRMKKFIFGERNGIHIIDLDQTMPRLVRALDFIREVVSQGGKILMVATKRQAQEPVREESVRSGQYYVNNRWLGGMLTNFRTVKRSIEVFKEQLATVADEEQTAELSKKDLSRLNRSIAKYQKSLDGLKEMQKLPDVMFVIDVNKEHLAIAEAQRLGIPVVAIVDTNCSPAGIDYPIPANDDAIRAIKLYCALVADACVEGDALYQERVTSQEPAQGETGATTRGGRRVVEIQQPPAQGGAARGGQREARGGRRPRQAGGAYSAGSADEPVNPRAPRPAPEAAAEAAPAAQAPEEPAPAAEAPATEASEAAPAAAETGDKPSES